MRLQSSIPRCLLGTNISNFAPLFLEAALSYNQEVGKGLPHFSETSQLNSYCAELVNMYKTTRALDSKDVTEVQFEKLLEELKKAYENAWPKLLHVTHSSEKKTKKIFMVIMGKSLRLVHRLEEDALKN